MKIIIILIYLLIDSLFAYTFVDKERILLDAKRLYNQYEMKLHQREAWEKRKELLISRFESNLSHDIHSKDEIFVKKARDRREEFYTSIKKRDLELNNSLKKLKSNLDKIKKEYFKLYSEKLTKVKIFGTYSTKASQKYEKIKIIKSYLSSKKLFNNYIKLDEQLQVKKSKLLNSKNLNNKQRYILLKKLNIKIENNYSVIIASYNRVQKFEKIYKDKYGVNIKDKNKADNLLRNILASN